MNSKHIFIASLIILFTGIGSYAADVDTVSIKSEAMKKAFNAVVIKPATYSADKKYPVVYLLHGHSGKYSNWVIKVPELKEHANTLDILIVCPDGGYSSWYFDSPIDKASQYETYIGAEVPAFIDSHYSTIPNRDGRAITGLSMGGHGALFIGLRHQSFYAQTGSMSGAVDLSTLKKSYDISQRIGDTVKYAGNWKNLSVATMMESYKSDSLKIIIDCGVDDFFYDINASLHKKMVKLKINHDYIERPGKHDWAYWKNAVKYQLLFFAGNFKRAN